jgi:gliding motility-associated-like protein
MMKRLLLFASIFLPVCCFTAELRAQSNTQTVDNGSSTTAINFQSAGCIYNWVNNTPGIGLAANGTGDIPPFTAINTGNTPITATITATPMQSPGYAYITNSRDSTISVINLYSQKIIATPKVGNTPIYIAVSPDGTTVYVSNFYGRSVSVINVATNLVTGTIPVAVEPAGLAVSPDGNKLYVCDSTIVSVFSTASPNKNLANITIGEYPNSVAFSPDGSTAYVTNNYSIKNNVSIINTATSKVTGFLTAGTDPTGVLVNPNGKYLYVANTYDNNISVFNTATNLLVTKIPVGTGPLGIAFSPDGQTLYVSNSGDNSTSKLAPGSVSVINLSNNKVITTIPLGGSTYPLGISVTPDGKQVYVVNDNTNNVSIINTATYAISTNSINVGQFPNSIGNFMAAGPPCTGSSITYTITVNPVSNITTGAVSGNISACQGNVSGSYQQFTVSADRLTDAVTATAPANFEVSLTANGGYGNSVMLSPDGSNINKAIIYVRSSVSAPIGNIGDNVVLSSPNTNDHDVAVSGTIDAAAVPTVFISVSGNDICKGTPVTFTATPYNGGTSPVYQWQVNGNNAGTNNVSFTSSALNKGDVVVCIMTSNAPCIAPASIASNTIIMDVATQVNVPLVSISASDNNTCAGSLVTFTAMPGNGGNAPAYQWQVNGNDAGMNSETFTSSTLQNGDVVTCLMTSSIGCSVPATVTSNPVTMNINALPVVNTGGDKTITAGKGVILNATVAGNITDITWSPATGLSNNKILNPVASPLSTTTYTLTVQTADDCVGTGMVTVQVTYPIIVPNTFSPNGDGRNDTWDIKYLNTYSNCKVQVFNRWGQLLYSSTGYGIPWDGTYKGSAVPNGTYYYVINLEKNTKPLAGYVMVVR